MVNCVTDLSYLGRFMLPGAASAFVSEGASQFQGKNHNYLFLIVLESARECRSSLQDGQILAFWATRK
jgi:hypothetical protein